MSPEQSLTPTGASSGQCLSSGQSRVDSHRSDMTSHPAVGETWPIADPSSGQSDTPGPALGELRRNVMSTGQSLTLGPALCRHGMSISGPAGSCPWNHTDLSSGQSLTHRFATVHSRGCVDTSSGQFVAPAPAIAGTRNLSRRRLDLRRRVNAIPNSGQAHTWDSSERDWSSENVSTAPEGRQPVETSKHRNQVSTSCPATRSDETAHQPGPDWEQFGPQNHSSTGPRTRHVARLSSRRSRHLTTRRHRQRHRKTDGVFPPAVLFTTTKLSPIGKYESQKPQGFVSC